MAVETLEDIRKLVLEDGETIRWAGLTGSREFVVLTVGRNGSMSKHKCDPMSWKPDIEVKRTLSFVESDSKLSKGISVSPPDSTVMAVTRRAAVFGVNVGGGCSSGACKKYEPIESCTLSYDIETSMENSREGGFALVDEDILSIAAKCSCTTEFYASLPSSSGPRELVSSFVLFVLQHMPMWMIGWNCYNFDNECMRYWCSDSIKGLFSVSRIGAFGKPSYGSIINIPGVYNVDLMVYMNKSLYKLPSFKLGKVAEYMGVTKKTEMPRMNSMVDQKELRTYNMNDCTVTMDIWKKEKLEYIIPSLAVCTASPVYDCCRYVTGTMAPLGYSSYVMSQGLAVEWGECTEPQNYAGGYVMEPVKGVHKNIVVCDFSSMYPTIVASCNIDPHELTIERLSHDVDIGTVEVSEHVTKVWLEGRAVSFDNRKESPVSKFMTFLVLERSVHKKTHHMYASSLKVLANSLYGSLGYNKSSVYSPTCAAAITAIGRHCVKTARSFLCTNGLTPLYGDTDSVMVSGEGSEADVVAAVEKALSSFHSEMSRTTLHMMSMQVEKYYEKGMMMDKKRYCMLEKNGMLKSVGISIARRDVSGVCKAAAEASVNSIFKDTKQQTIDDISKFVFAVSQMAVENSFKLSDVARYVKRDGISGYEYHDALEGRRFVPEAEANLSCRVNADACATLLSVREEIERFTVPCCIGKVADIIRAASAESW